MVRSRRAHLRLVAIDGEGKGKKNEQRARRSLLNKWWRSVLGNLRGSAILGKFPAAWRSIRLE